MALGTPIPVITLTRAGVAPGTAGGNEITPSLSTEHPFVNDDRTFLHARNTDAGASRTITLMIANGVDGQVVPHKTVSVPASGERLIGPFPSGIYGQPSDNMRVWIQVDDVDFRLCCYKF